MQQTKKIDNKVISNIFFNSLEFIEWYHEMGLYKYVVIVWLFFITLSR